MTGITTITVDSNYGNRLQNYAVQSVLKKLGIKSATLFYKTPFIRSLKNFVKVLIGRRKALPFIRKNATLPFVVSIINILILSAWKNRGYMTCMTSWTMLFAARIRYGISISRM